MKLNTNDSKDFAAFISIDWADRQHVFCLQVNGRQSIETGVLEQKPQALSLWVAQLRERFGGRQVAIALEQSRGALIHGLVDHDFIVLYALHPTTVAKFRQAFRSSGSKSDPVDAAEILEILTKHWDKLRALNPDTEQTRLLRRLVQDRRKAVDCRTKHIEALIASIKEYFPQYLELVSGNLDSRLAGDLLKKWPTFEAFQQAKPKTIRSFFYGHNIRSESLVQRALHLAEQSTSLTTDAAIVESGRRLSQMHSQLIQCLNTVVQDYDQRIAKIFGDYSEAYLFENLPGAGRVMAPRLAAFFGTDRSRYDSATNVQSFTGVAPATKQSGRSKLVYARWACPKFDRQTFHEFARLSVTRCQWARNYVDYCSNQNPKKKDRKTYHVIIRGLAFKWIRILFHCWKNRIPYNENLYLETLRKRGSRFAAPQTKPASQTKLPA